MWSARRMRWTLWVVTLLVCPVPYGGLEHGWVPPLWLVGMAALTGIAVLLEGGTTPAQITLVFVLQAALAAGMLWAASAGVVALSERMLGLARTRQVFWGLLVLLVVLTLCPVYRSPISHTAGWATLAGLWR